MEIRKRKPLSDITNAYGLIPTSTLRKLVSSSSGSKSIPAFKPPISILKPGSGSGGQKGCPDSSTNFNGLDTSIGSSVSDALTSRTVRFHNGDMGNKDIERHTATERSKNERKTSGMTESSTPLANKKDKGKAIAELPSFTPHRKFGKPCSSLEKPEENDVEILSLFSGSFDNVNGFGKGILNPSSCSHEKIENRNENLNYAGFSKNKTQELGKGIASHSSYSFDKKEDEVELILELPDSSIQKTKTIGKVTLNSNDFLVDKAKEKLNTLIHPSYSNEKEREKRKALLTPRNTVTGSSAAVALNCQPVRRKTVKTNKDSGASSCPPMRRIQKMLNGFDEAGDMKSLKSLTAPRPKLKKKQRSQPKNGDESCLPLDFIEQQRAYFKEVDEFELAEEEISQDELD